MNARHLVDFSRPAPSLQVQLKASGVAVTVSGKTLLQPASVRFEAGKVTAILGPNGAGKSTFMSVLTGQRKASQGRIELAGQALQTYLPGDLARKRAFLAQESQVAFDFTVQEVVELGRYPHRRQPSRHEATIALQAMQATAVDHLSDRPLNTLSGGERARVHLARALAQVWHGTGDQSTRWLLLDEPTAALDLQHQHRMLQLVRDWACQQGVGVVAVLHDLNLALRYSDRCVLLQGGQVVDSGVTREVLTPLRIRQVWGVLAQPVPPGTAGQVPQYVFGPALEDTAHPGSPRG